MRSFYLVFRERVVTELGTRRRGIVRLSRHQNHVFGQLLEVSSWLITNSCSKVLDPADGYLPGPAVGASMLVVVRQKRNINVAST
jgi:steroid 5-alpha reductase family enzyme